MKIRFKYQLLLVLVLFLSSCYEESKLLVKAEFQTKVENHTAPVKLTIENNSIGADFYLWTFEGAEPSTSKEKEPGSIVYNQAGTYVIKLEAWNNHERDIKEYTLEVNSAVDIDFDIEVLTNAIAPAEIKITNNTKGALSYQWTFMGGSPSESKEQFPSNVLFQNEGEHTITLVVSNGGEEFTLSKSFTLETPMSTDFEIIPTLDDFDYEAPLTAELKNLTSNGVSYQWETSGGIIQNPTTEHSSVYFAQAGTYTVTLIASDGKRTERVSKEIVVKANTNLYTLENVRLGIKAAENTVGSFFSLATRSTLPSKDVTADNGKDIGLAFFALDAGFSRCYFTSPTDVIQSGFAPIPNAKKTFFINKLEDTSIAFSDVDFIAMKDDTKLKQLDIKNNSNTTSWFTNIQIPRLILFETAEGVKGAIRIKAFVSEGLNSYILTDIKIQKKKLAE